MEIGEVDLSAVDFRPAIEVDDVGGRKLSRYCIFQFYSD